MPTIAQLPVAQGTSPTDEFPVSQGDVTRGVTLATLLANLQPLIVLNGDVLLGRTTPGAGGVELITLGSRLALTAGTLSATVPAFLTGAGVPAAGLGVPGDSYLDISTGNLWLLVGQTWTSTGNNILLAEARARAVALGPLIALTASSVGTIPVQLTLDGTAQTAATTLMLPNARSIMRLTGTITAQNLASGDAMVWDVAAAIRRSGPGTAAELIGSASISTFAADASMSGCQVAIAGSQLGGVVECVGLNGMAINWSAAFLVVNGI